MKALLALLLLLIPATLLAQRPKEILHDFRASGNSQPPKIRAATQRAVLSKVFRKYLTDGSKCDPNFDGNGSDDYLKAARLAGQIAPTIVDSVTGSFTGPGQYQIAYIVSVSECNASHADNFGTDRIAIFNGPQLVVDLDLDFRNSIVRKTDLNGDGVDELLMTSGYMGQGVLTEGAALLSFQNGKMRVIEDLGTVIDDSCASGFPGSSVKASVISYSTVAVPGRMPKLQIENYTASCRSPKKWRFFSRGKMEGQ